MNFTRSSMIAVLCVLVTASLLPAADALEAATADPQQVLDELWPGLVAETPESRRDAEQQWQDFCFQAGSPGRESGRVAACRVMGRKLEHNPGAPATIWLLKQLQFIGGAESVAVVATQLDSTDPLVRDAARRALAHNPSVEAGTALRDRLKKAADSDRKAGLIGALGFRAEEASVPTLAKLMHDADAKVVAAAAKALGSIGTASAVRSLAEAHKQAVGETRLPISDAY
ncbi:MAG: HEAT repeat domain-containing protein, partial [Planctomycetes bacterium]|nr:HEAT repeat domain-containing protein [Planctomycetota bacterium]